eukprot:1150982-Pelagomonas_calceolata.AAC.2
MNADLQAALCQATAEAHLQGGLRACKCSSNWDEQHTFASNSVFWKWQKKMPQISAAAAAAHFRGELGACKCRSTREMQHKFVSSVRAASKWQIVPLISARP